MRDTYTPWAPIIVNGSTGVGKTTTVALLMEIAGAKTCYRTTKTPNARFDAEVNWDAIDFLIIDEINGWEKSSLRDALPKLLAQAKAQEKGIVLIGQSVQTSAIADILPEDSRWMSMSREWNTFFDSALRATSETPFPNAHSL